MLDDYSQNFQYNGMSSGRITPLPFIYRRLHSLFGLAIVLFLIEHIITNSQAAFLFGEDGEGFVRAVNFIKNLPYLPVIEIALIGIPILFHAVWGIKYALSGSANSFPSSGATPFLTQYPRNHAYTWQRITSWILLIGIALHVGYMRFYRYPTEVRVNGKPLYLNWVNPDPGLQGVAERLGVQLYTPAEAEVEPGLSSLLPEKLKMRPLITVTPNFGTSTLLMVRDAFKSPFKAALYTIFVLAAAFHAFNGLWTFCITWGVILSMRSQKRMVTVCYAIMGIIAFLGLASVWGTYWINLKT